MTSLSQHQKPKLVERVNILALPIGPEEAFVISRIDGSTSLLDIALSTGLETERVWRILDRLAELGVLAERVEPASGVTEVAERQSSPAERSMSAHPNTMPSPRVQMISSPCGDPFDSGRVSSIPPTASPPARRPTSGALRYDISELEEPVELEPERKHQVLQLYYSLGSSDHYELLGVKSDVDKKAVKNAYFNLVSILHPDRYFGKNLGSFKEKLERCFTRITEAHDVLSRRNSRQEYDAYLDNQRQALRLEEMLSTNVTLGDLDNLEQSLLAEFDSRGLKPQPLPRILEPVELAHPEPEPRIIDSSPSSAPQPCSSQRQLSEEERRQALLRKLRGGPVGQRPSVPPPPPVSARELAAVSLRQIYAQHGQRSYDERMRNHLDAADEALKRNDPIRAVQSLRIAGSMSPDDPGLKRRLVEVQELAEGALADTYQRQGEYEEKNGRPEEASRSYERAARAHNTAELWERAARCSLAAGTDLRLAGELVKKALALEPERASSHLLIGRVFVAANKPASAVTSLERAHRLAPEDVTILDLLSRVRRGEA